MQCPCGNNLKAVSLREVTPCSVCGVGMSTGFACESVRDLVCDTCVGNGFDGVFDGALLVHRGEKFGDGFEAPEPQGDGGGNGKES